MLAVGSCSFSFSFFLSLRSFYSVAFADPLEEGMSFQLSLFAGAKRRLLIWVPTVELQVVVQLHRTDRHIASPWFLR